MAGKSAGANLKICLFGPFELLLQGRPLPELRSRKGQWLLALLILRSGSVLERSWIAGCLWPESSEEQGLVNLRQSLKSLRQALGPEAARLQASNTHTLSFDTTDADIDVLEFDHAIKKQSEESLTQALALYRGPLLEGCDAAWCVPERMPREHSFLNALESLATNAMCANRFREAEGYLRRLLLLDPYRESAHRSLMRALAAAGDYAEAIHTYRALRLRLHQELTHETDAETTALFKRICADARQTGRSSPSEIPRGEFVERRAPEQPPSLPISSPGMFGRIPRPLTPLIGRVQELTELVDCMMGERLLTLTGPGGIGKTRLAIALAERVASNYAGGVVFIELAALSKADLVLPAVAAAFGVTEQWESPLLTQLQSVLQEKHLLLTLDNCEHLIEACAQLTETLLQSCPDLSILTTSREVLGLTGERIRRVPSLSLPGERNPSGEQDTEEPPESSGSLRLFMARATAARPDFVLSIEETPLAVQICRRLDGIPLAIEMAAARVRVLSLKQIADRLDDRFALLTGGNRTALPRHQTLSAMIQWSYDLLSDMDQVMIQRLSLFAGGWTLEAAEGICSDDPFTLTRYTAREATSDPNETLTYSGSESKAIRIPRERVLDLLTALVDKSLVVVEERTEEGVRYRQLETIRQFCLERLKESGEAERMQRRFCAWFVRLVEQTKPPFPDSEHWQQGQAELNHLRQTFSLIERTNLKIDLDNLRLALQLLQGSAPEEERELALRLAIALRHIWLLDGFMEGYRWVKDALERYPYRNRLRARALAVASNLTLNLGDDDTAFRLSEECLALTKEIGQTTDIKDALISLGQVAAYRSDRATAKRLFTEALTLAEQIGSHLGMANALNYLGCIAFSEGDYAASEEFHRRCMQINQEIGNLDGIPWNQNNLADVARAQGHYAEALDLYVKCLISFHIHQNMRGNAACFDGIAATIAHSEGTPQSDILAVKLLAAGETCRQICGLGIPPFEHQVNTESGMRLQSRMDSADFAGAWSQGREMPLDQAVVLALECC